MVYIFVSLNEDFMHSVAKNLISFFFLLLFLRLEGKQQGSHSHFHIALLSCKQCKCVVKGCKEIVCNVCI